MYRTVSSDFLNKNKQYSKSAVKIIPNVIDLINC